MLVNDTLGHERIETTYATPPVRLNALRARLVSPR